MIMRLLRLESRFGMRIKIDLVPQIGMVNEQSKEKIEKK